MTHPLRKAAQGQPCTLRLPGCDGGVVSGTTVLAHLYVGPKAMGGKGPDWFGCHACMWCHSALDAYNADDRYKVMLQALQETLQNLFDRGLITISGKEKPFQDRKPSKIIPHKGVSSL